MTAELDARGESFLKLVAAVSLVYDCLLGVSMLFLQSQVVGLLGLEPPRYPVNGNLNGIFAFAVGLGYLAVLRDPHRNRWYLWLMGVALKGSGVVVLAYDYWIRGGPASFLLFAVSDGALAIASLAALMGFVSSGGGGSGVNHSMNRRIKPFQ